MRQRNLRTTGRGKHFLIIHHERDPWPVTRRSNRPTHRSRASTWWAGAKKEESMTAGWGRSGCASGNAFRFSVGLIAGSRAWDPRYPLREHDEGVAINLSGSLSHLRESCGSSSPARSYEEITEGRIARWGALLLWYNNTDIFLIRSHGNSYSSYYNHYSGFTAKFLCVSFWH